MEVCPKCHNHSLEYDPHGRSARCLRMDCDFRESMDFSEYSERFEREEKNVADRLTLPMNRRAIT